MDHLPAGLLIRVAPGVEECRRVLGHPQEEADEDEGERRRHPVAVSPDRESNLRAVQGDEERHRDRPAQIDDVVVGEEVRVDREGEGAHRPPAETVDVQVEAPEGLADVGADRGVHEAREDRHSPEAHDPGVEVGPGALVHFEDLEGEAEDVEDADDAELPPGLELEGDEGDLHDHDVDEERVVAGDRHIPPAPHEGGGGEAEEDGRWEQAALDLHPRELDEAQREESEIAQRTAFGHGLREARGAEELSKKEPTRRDPKR